MVLLAESPQENHPYCHPHEPNLLKEKEYFATGNFYSPTAVDGHLKFSSVSFCFVLFLS